MEETLIYKEQRCRSCNSIIDGNFCKQCGQKVVEHNQTVGQLVLHFMADIFHYDGRLMKTLRLLLTKPGALPLKYIQGIRQPYVEPFRLYLFISAMAFVMLASDEHEEPVTKIGNPAAIHTIDSIRAALLADTTHGLKIRKSRYNRAKFDVNGAKVLILDPADVLRHGERYYDSVQSTLPPQKRISRYFRYKDRKFIKAYEIFDTAPYNYGQKYAERINLMIPKTFFISMPFSILTLFLLYYKKRNQYPSANHAIFTLHAYIVLWIFFTIDGIISLLLEHPGTQLIYTCIAYTILLGLFVYIFIAMLRFYQEPWWVTLVKMIALLISAGLAFMLILYALREYFELSLDSLPA